MQDEDPELPLTPGQLKALYSYQFSAPGVTRPDFAAGWMPVVVSMCRTVDALMRDRLDRYSFVWIQFKEKFGVARLAYQLRELCDDSGDGPESPETRELRQRLLEIRLKAEMQTRTLCMVCGQRAEWQEEIAEFLDQPVEVVQGLEGAAPQIREAALLSTYRAGIKNALPAQRARFRPRTAYVRVMDRDRERAKYHLVYLTTHPVGIIEFMQISQGVELIQKRVRAAKKAEIRQQQSGMDDMFAKAYDDLIGDDEQASSNVVDLFWLEYLSTSPTVVDEDAFADILEQQGWTPNDLQASLVRLIKAGKVSNINATNLRPKRPLHYEKKEQLVLTN